MGVELFLPFLGSIFVFWLLRRLDKGNINLKKIKGMLDAGERRLHDIVLKKAEELKDATTEFDILQVNAQKQIESLKNEILKIEHSYTEIDSKYGHLKNIEEELGQLETTTHSVRGEIGFIDESLGKVDFQHKRLKKIEERINIVDSEASRMVKAFQENLNQKSKELTNTMENKVRDIFLKSEDYQKELQDQIEAYQSKLNQGVQREYELLKETIKQDGQNLSEDLRRKFDQHLDISQEIEEKIENIEGKIDHSIPEMLQELKDKIIMSFSENETKSQSLLKSIKESEENLSQNMKSFQENIDQQKQEVSRNFLKEVDHLKDQIRQLDFETISKKDEMVQATRKEVEKIEAHVENFKEFYEKAKEEYIIKINDERVTLENKVSDIYEKYQMQILDNIRQVDQKGEEVFSEIDKKLSTAREEFPKIHSLIHEFEQMYKDSISEYTEKLNSEKGKFYKDIEKIFGMYEEKSTENFHSLVQEEDNIKQRLQKVFLEYTKKLEEDFESVSQEIQGHSLHFKGLTKKCQLEMESIAANTQDSLNQGKISLEKQESEIMQKLVEHSAEFIESEKNKFNEDLQNLIRKFQKETKEISFLKHDLETKQANLLDHLKEQRKSLENELKTVSYEKLELFEKEGYNKIDKLQINIDEQVESGRAQLLEFQEDFVKDMQKHQQKQESEMSKVHSELRHSEDEIIYIKNALAELKADSSIIDTIENKINVLKDMMSKLDTYIRETNDKQKMVDHLFDQVEQFKEIRVKLDTEISMLSEKRDKVDHIEEKLNSVIHVNSEIEEKQEHIEEIKALADDVSKNQKQVQIEKIKVEEALEDLLNQQKLIESAIQSINAQDRSINDLSEHISQIDLLLKKLDTKSENLHAHMEDITTKMLSLEKNESEIEAIQQKFLQIEDLLEDIEKRKNQIEIMRKRYEDIKDSLGASVEQIERIENNAEEKVKKLAELINAVGSDLSVPELSKVKANKKDVVIKLSQMGWSNDEIADKINMDMSAVDTILSTSSHL